MEAGGSDAESFAAQWPELAGAAARLDPDDPRIAEIVGRIEESVARRAANGQRAYSLAEIRAEASLLVRDMVSEATSGRRGSPIIRAMWTARQRNLDRPRMLNGSDVDEFAARAIIWLHQSAGRGSLLADLEAAQSAITADGREPGLDAEFVRFIRGRLDGSIDDDTAMRMFNRSSRTARETRRAREPETTSAGPAEQLPLATQVLDEAVANAGGVSALCADPRSGWLAFLSFANARAGVPEQREDAPEGPLLLFEWGSELMVPSTYVRAVRQFEIWDADGGPDHRQIGLEWTFDRDLEVGSGAIWEDDGDWSALVEASAGFALLNRPARRVTVTDELTE